MRKDTALSFRVPRRLKAELQKVALTEGLSLAQVCEALLGGGLEIYEAEGSKSFQRLLSRRKKNPPISCGFTPAIRPRVANGSIDYEYRSLWLRCWEHPKTPRVCNERSAITLRSNS